MKSAAATRRSFLQSIGTAAGIPALGSTKVKVGAHPWAYAAPLPRYDITPVLDQIFSDLSGAGVDGVELMHTALRHSDAVPRIRELSKKYDLPVIGASYEAPMYDRSKHAEIFADASAVIERDAEVGG